MTTETIELANLKTTYQALMLRYVELLRFVASNEVGWKHWVTRQVMEDHVRINIREIIEALILFEFYSLDPDSDSDEESGSWLHKQIDYLTRLAEQLADFQKQVLTIAWRSWVLIIGYVLFRVSGTTDQTQNLSFVFDNFSTFMQALLIASGLTILTFCFVLAFTGIYLVSQKTSYLRPGYDESGRQTVKVEGDSIYKLENDLFQLLQRKKPRDSSWDIWGLAFFMVAVAVLFVGYIYYELAPSALEKAVIWVWIGGLLVTGGWVAYFFREIKRRLRRYSS